MVSTSGLVCLAEKGRLQSSALTTCQQGFRHPLCPLQVRSVPVRKDDEVTVVRGTYKVGLHAGKQLAGRQWECSPVT